MNMQAGSHTIIAPVIEAEPDPPFRRGCTFKFLIPRIRRGSTGHAVFIYIYIVRWLSSKTSAKLLNLLYPLPRGNPLHLNYVTLRLKNISQVFGRPGCQRRCCVSGSEMG